jgi:TonB family protein
MKFRFLMFMLLMIALRLAAQKDTVYLNKFGDKCYPAEATALQCFTRIADKKYKVETYKYSTGKLASIGYCLTPDSASLEGPFETFHENGQKASEGNYAFNKLIGEWKHYYESNGKLWYVEHFNGGFKDGELKSYYETGELKREEIRKFFGKMVDGKCFNKKGKEIKFTPFEIMPKPDYELPAYLAKNINYPDAARENNLEGRVLLKFYVDENGRIKDVEVKRHVSPEIDAEAIRVVSEMPRWEPGQIDDKVVNTYFYLPIVFALE